MSLSAAGIFSLQGGWQVKATNANNPIIENNYFKIGANGLQPINLLGVPNGFTGQGATIINNVSTEITSISAVRRSLRFRAAARLSFSTIYRECRPRPDPCWR